MDAHTENVDQMEVKYPLGEDSLYPGEVLTETLVATGNQSIELEMEIELAPEFAQELDIVEVEILDDEMDGSEDQFNLELDYFDVEQQEEKLWQARTGLTRETLCGAIETVIFMSDKPVAITKIKTLIDEDMPLRVIHESIEKLQEEYEEKHHGLRLVEVADGYQYRTKATYSKYVQDLFKVHSLILSPTALEVLAIIAYKQPVSRIEVEKIRGVDSSHIVRALMDKRLVKVSGRSDEMGRPVLYSTTPEFLEVFNLANLEELPPEHELSEIAESGFGKMSDIRTFVKEGDKGSFVFDEVDELDKLTEDIKKINSDTAFIQSLKSEEKKRIGESGTEVKSAFDLLEEYLDEALIKDHNKSAAASELFTALLMPEVITNLTAGPFNVPDVEDDEDFEMIDLDTGEAIIFSDEDEIEVELEASESESEESNEEIEEKFEEEVELFNLDGVETPEEIAQSLSDALDKAFEDLTGESLEAVPLDGLDNEQDIQADNGKLLEKELKIGQVTENILDQAQELDIDLSFLEDLDSEEDEKSTHSGEE